MSWLVSRRWRIFVIVWIVYSLHFATNIVREHYPAFSLVEHGTFRVDEYQGFHSDIFVHRDGHSVIGNQVLVSALAAVPLFVFDPVLDALEHRSKVRLAERGVTDAEYRIDKPMRRDFFRLVKERGLDLRFGGAAVVTTVFFMAPLTAAFVAFFYQVLTRRGVSPSRATALSFLLAFGTPFFYRATVLGHNMFVMFFTFIAFVLLWVPPGESFPVSSGRRLAAGFFGGLTLATDYMGVLILPLLYGYLVLPRLSTTSWRVSLKESLPMVIGSLPPIAFLLFTQWAMYGHPFWPGQHWMPNQNIYVNVGARGFTFVDAELFLQNLFHPGFGMFVWGPILLLAFIPAWWYPDGSLILPRRERRFVVITTIVLMLFCATNQYARLQWNSGFRYLMPLVPFLFLALSDHWVRLPAWLRVPMATITVVQCWVLAAFREQTPRAWREFFVEGPQLPWYRVLSMTSNPDNPWLGTWWIPTLLLAATAVLVIGIWMLGSRLEIRRVERLRLHPDPSRAV